MYKVKYKFKNGERVKDIVSGFNGVIDCCSIWINGCKRYSVQPKMKEGETARPDSIWIDEESLILLDSGVSKDIKPTDTGGPSFSSSSARM